MASHGPGTGRPPAATSAAPARPPWVRPVVVVVVVLVCGWLASTFLGAIDWAAVGAAMRRLTAWQLLVLVAVLLVRQFLNALPLALFIEGLGAGRALLNDLVAALMAVVAPPPGDLVMRVAMFRGWGIDASRGLAGATMNMLVFYVNRFAAPVVGLLVLVGLSSGTHRVWPAVGSGLVAVAIAVVVSLMVRQERFAAGLGRLAGTAVGRFRSSVDPAAWETAATDFRGHVATGYRRAFSRSLVALTVMVLSDATILLLSLRFVGVSAAEVPAYEVIGVFFLAYPLTLPPLMGLGVFDLALLAAYMELGGAEIEPEVVAALTVWRAVTLAGPVVIGGLTLLAWRRARVTR